MENDNINEQLVSAVSGFNYNKVKWCLNNGADPNYEIKIIDCEREEDGQPTRPLKLVMFRISDCDLRDEDLREFAEIAKVLLQFGADPKPAMIIAESRYGKYNANYEDGPMMDVWRIIANAI